MIAFVGQPVLGIQNYGRVGAGIHAKPAPGALFTVQINEGVPIENRPSRADFQAWRRHALMTDSGFSREYPLRQNTDPRALQIIFFRLFEGTDQFTDETSHADIFIYF